MLNRYCLYMEDRHFQGHGRKGISLCAWNVCCPDLEHVHMNTHTLHADIHRERGRQGMGVFFLSVKSSYTASIQNMYYLYVQ